MDPADEEAAKASKELDSSLKRQKQKEEEEIKLLLLGAGESGKSTIFKQMQIIHKGGYTKEDRMQFIEVIHVNIVQSTKVLLNACKKLSIPLDSGHEEIGERISNMPVPADFKLSPDNTADVKTLWSADSGIQAAYKRRAEFQLNDSAEYFFKNLDRVAAKDYCPDEQDVLRARVRTTGIIEAEFEVNGYRFKMFDVGGQRSERRKWIHCFENVTAVVFCVGLSEYDQVLLEDETQNRMKEALDLFNEICNSRWFEKTSIILFLNKKDLFEEKIKKVDLKVCFPAYNGGCDYNKAVQYIENEFKKLNQRSDVKQVYAHHTCATDTNNVKFVFDAIRDIILQGNLRDSGIM